MRVFFLVLLLLVDWILSPFINSPSSNVITAPKQFMAVVESVEPSDNETDTLAEFHRLLNDQGHSDYVVVYLRLITSGKLQEEAEFYSNFIDGNCSMEEFRHQEVEPMYKESDHIHIIGMLCYSVSSIRKKRLLSFFCVRSAFQLCAVH